MSSHLSSQALANAREFIYKNGRLLDRKRYEYWFENGSADHVLSVLRAYQNDDGGFGHALEPDIRCPHSQPVATEMALSIMNEMNAYDPQIVEGIGNFLQQIAVKGTGGFPRAFRTLNDYPHAPWWTTEDDSEPSMNPTGNIIGLLYRQSVCGHILEQPWFRQTVEFIWTHIEAVNPSDYHDVIQCITFLENTPDRSKAERLIPLLDEWLSQPGTIECDPNAEGYVHKVLDWAPTPDSYCSKFIQEADVQRHLSHLIEQQQADGGWLVSWPAVSPAGEMEWRGWITVERLKTLKAYGRIPQ